MEGVDADDVSSKFVDAMSRNMDVSSGDYVILIDDSIGKQDTRCIDIEDDDTKR